MAAFNWNEEMMDSGDEMETRAKRFWRANMFDSREVWQVRARPVLVRCVRS